MNDDDDFLNLGNVSSLYEVALGANKSGPVYDGYQKKAKIFKHTDNNDQLDDSELSGEENDNEENAQEITDYLYHLAENEFQPQSTENRFTINTKLNKKTPKVKEKSSAHVIAKHAVEASTTLTQSQAECVEQMLQLENSASSGGMLLEQNPYNKTTMMIEICDKQSNHIYHKHITSDVVESNGTLILTVHALVSQWVTLLRKHLPDKKTISSGNLSAQNVFQLAEPDFVVTTYAHLHKDIPIEDHSIPTPYKALSVHWQRVIYDEPNFIHFYKNSWLPCQLTLGLIRAKYRWITTTEPIKNGCYPTLQTMSYLLQLPILSQVPKSYALSPSNLHKFRKNPKSLPTQRKQYAKRDLDSTFAEALHTVTVQDVASMTFSQPVFLQRVQVDASVQEKVLRNAYLSYVRSKVRKAYNHLSNPNLSEDESTNSYYKYQLRAETYGYCLALREISLSPRLHLYGIHRKRKLHENGDFEDDLSANEEMKVRLFRKKLGLQDGDNKDKLPKKAHKSPIKTYAKHVFQSLENSESSLYEKSVDKECQICYAESVEEDGSLLPCGHRMCNDCCRRVLSTDRKCPFCKQKTLLKDAVSIRAIRCMATKSQTVDDAPTIYNISLKDYFFFESSKTKQVAIDIEALMAHSDETHSARPQCLILTEFSDHNLALANVLQARKISTMTLSTVFRKTFSYNRLIRGYRHISSKNLNESTKVYRINPTHAFEKDFFAGADSQAINDILYEMPRVSPSSSVQHSSDIIKGSAVIANFSLLHTGVDLSWADYLFIMEPFLFDRDELYETVSKCINAKREKPLYITMYESEGSIDERINSIVHGDYYPHDSVKTDEPVRNDFLHGNATGCSDISQSASAWLQADIVADSTATNPVWRSLHEFLEKASVEEVMQMIGLA